MKTAHGDERPFRVSERMTIGRETRCHVRIAVPSVANRHCELVVDDDGVLRLADLGSDRGTYHNGARVREAVLNHADTLTVGPVTFEVRIDEPASGADTSARAMQDVEVRTISRGREGSITTTDAEQSV